MAAQFFGLRCFLCISPWLAVPNLLTAKRTDSFLQQPTDELSECADVMAVETRMPVGVALLQRPDYADAAVSEYFFNGTDRSRCLAKQPVPWPWCSRCSYHSSFLPPHQRLRPCRPVVIHHGIYHAVKQPLQRSRDIAPVTRCPYNYTVMLA